MLTKLDKDTARAFIRLRNDTPMVQFLESELTMMHKMLVLSEKDTSVRQLQGRAQVLQDLLDLIGNSVKIAEKLGA